MSSFSFNMEFVKSLPGLAVVGEVAFSFGGAIVNLFAGSGFQGFIFWSTIFISGLFLVARITTLAGILKTAVPIYSKLELGYVTLWTVFFALATFMSFANFALSALFVYACLAVFCMDLFFKFKEFRSGATGMAPTDATPAAEAATDEGIV